MPIPMPIQEHDRQHPLLQVEPMNLATGQVSMRGNLVLLSLNLSRMFNGVEDSRISLSLPVLVGNYLTVKSVFEFLLSVEYQLKIIESQPSKNAASMEFSGLCRLELKVNSVRCFLSWVSNAYCQGMNEISVKSPAYQSLDALLLRKSPSTRFQQLRERENKANLDQQSGPIVVPPAPASVSERPRRASRRFFLHCSTMDMFSDSSFRFSTDDTLERVTGMLRPFCFFKPDRINQQRETLLFSRSHFPDTCQAQRGVTSIWNFIRDDSWCSPKRTILILAKPSRSLTNTISPEVGSAVAQCTTTATIRSDSDAYEYVEIEKRQDCQQLENYLRYLALTDRRQVRSAIPVSIRVTFLIF